ncbi:MAG: ABC transporter permease [Actinomycetota bacterium]|nr:ABC transporter permease [Actinomycetota bacterium]
MAQLEIRRRTGASCVEENGFCPDWIVENLDRYVDPFLQHVYLTVISVGIGFAIAAALGILAHRKRWLSAPFLAITGALFTIPSPAAFLLLLPFTGFGAATAIIALVVYTQVIIFRNVTNGLRNVPAEVVDAARGQGLTDGQILRKVELPLALPEILAGLRIAGTSTVGLATLAFFAGAGGLGEEIESQINFKSNVAVGGGLAVLLAAGLDLLILGVQRLATPWTRAHA